MKQEVVLRLLPEVFREALGDCPVLEATTAVMAEQHVRPERVLADLDLFFRPRTTPERYLPALASWVDLDWVLTGEQRAGREPYGPGPERLRDLVASMRSLSSWRGTESGLTAFLETAVGVRGFVVTASATTPFHIEVVVPTAAAPHLGLVDRIVAEQKPVCITHEVALDSEATQEGDPDGR